MDVTFQDILAAQSRLASVVHTTPVLLSINEVDSQAATLYYKCENLQRCGVFKIRGAFSKMSAIPEPQRQRGVVTYSSGNHARAVATAAKLLGTHAKIVMPADAPAIKMAATRSLGAEIVIYDRYKENRESIAQAICEREGRTLVPPYDDPLVIAGQGTIGLELAAQIEQLDFVVAPVGGGGLIAGIATALAHKRSQVQIIGAEAESANDTFLSLREGRRVEIPVPKTIADGMQVTSPGKLTFPIIQKLVREIVLISEEEIRQAMQFAAEQIRQIVEPTAAVAAAAAQKIAARHPGAHIAVVLSGGNVDLQKYTTQLPFSED